MTPREKALELQEPVSVIESEPETHFFDYLIVLTKRKSMIFKIVGAVVILTIGNVIWWPNQFMATTKILPPQQGQSIGAAMMASQLGGLGALLGSSIGLKNPSDLYVAMLKSRSVADPLVNRFDLMARYEKKTREDAIRTLGGVTQIKVEKEGIITLSVEDRDPAFAAELANAYVVELRVLTKYLAVTEAQKRRVFFADELKNANVELSDAEQNFKKMQMETGLYLVDSQSKAILASLSSIRGQIALKEIEIKELNTFASPDNPDLVLAQKDLAALHEQELKLETGQGGKGTNGVANVPLEKVPEAGLRYIRALREVKYRETLFELLAKQYETAKIDEAKDAVLVQQLDPALPPARKSSPHRATILLMMIILSSLAAGTLAFVLEAFEKAQDDPNFQTRYQTFRYYLRGSRQSKS